jgi:protein phosphatase
MLICPQCKFENPNSNKFCQNCGTSLAHKVCPECSTDDVPVNALSCHNCGAECGTVFWAIITKKTAGEVLGDERAIFSSSSEIPLSSYLDSQKRYQLLEPLPAQTETATITDVGIRVIDCQPYQMSPIDAMLASQQSDLLTPSVEVSEIPGVAKLYIALQSQGERGIPPIHDAWQQGDMQVVIIEDRSNWQHLLDLWQQETTSSLKILHWCYEMTQLWAVLEPVNCCQSLLNLSNLRLDEDQTLALQRLYVESSNSQPIAESSEDAQAQTSAISEEPLTIQALGRVWQTLFRQSQRTQFGSVVQMLGDLEIGKIETIAQLRSRLQEISVELEALGLSLIHI